MTDTRDPGPEAVDKILDDLEGLVLQPAEVARQARRLRVHIQNMRSALRPFARASSVEDAIERGRQCCKHAGLADHLRVREGFDFTFGDLRTLLSTLERPAEKEIVGRLYDAAFKARWFVEKASRGAEFTEIGKANAKDVLGLLNTALEAARKQS